MKAFGSLFVSFLLLLSSTAALSPTNTPRQVACTSLFSQDSSSSSMSSGSKALIPSSSSHDDPHPFTSMMRGWLSLMVPMAWITWRHTLSIPLTLCSFLAAPVFAIFQGTLGILRYRVLYGDAPLPLSPAHGVVVVNPNDSTNTTSTTRTTTATSSFITQECCCLGGSRWRTNTTTISDEERLVLDRALHEQRPTSSLGDWRFTCHWCRNTFFLYTIVTRSH